ncbi:MAG: exopolysaccharide biosynthesis protein [Thiogranum sp.]|nr:exopolysaccharide biosynthesis protein [Thiogranum sp.]
MDERQSDQPADMATLLDRIEASIRREESVSTEMVLNAVGRRSFGPLLLVPGLITLAPLIGDIPGVPTLMGVLVLLVAVQLVIGRSHFWLPHWLLNRSVNGSKVCRVLKWLRPVARFLDRISKQRLTALTRGLGSWVIAVACVLIALALPPMEFIPFSANGAGAALTLFGLSLIAHDGLLALVGLLVTGGTFVAVVYGLT